MPLPITVTPSPVPLHFFLLLVFRQVIEFEAEPVRQGKRPNCTYKVNFSSLNRSLFFLLLAASSSRDFFFFFSFSFLHPAVPCSAGAAPPASRQNSSIRAQEKQKMAVAGCPDYFLHHPNYQVSGHLLSDFFFYVLIIDDVIDCVFLT